MTLCESDGGRSRHPCHECLRPTPRHSLQSRTKVCGVHFDGLLCDEFDRVPGEHGALFRPTIASELTVHVVDHGQFRHALGLQIPQQLLGHSCPVRGVM